MATTYSGLAHAKLNLILEVGPHRDDGYHEIDTIMQELALADRVEVSFGEFEGMRISGPFADGTPADGKNLAWQAAFELAVRCGRSIEGLGIALEKQIPAAGGLGGGASDAAAVLRLLQSAWNASGEDVLAAAVAVGSDEAFFLTGGTARAQGRGEVVTPLPAIERHGVVLFIPPETIESKTARMFAALDELPVETPSRSAAFAQEQRIRVAGTDITNSFERVARSLFAGLDTLWNDLEQRCGEPLHLAGAGPTLFWIGGLDRAASIATAARGTACAVIETETAGAVR